MSNSFPPLTSGEYVVNDGDTLASIGYNLFGDASYGKLLGAANGVSDDINLSGRPLQEPAFVQSKFSASTSAPYNQLMSSVVANLFPIMNTPQPPDDDNPFAEMLDIIIIIAAVVVSVMTFNPEIGAGAVAVTATAAATAAVEAGVMAAAIAVTAEVATEELETQLGWRQHFSLRHAAQIAVEAGFGAASFEMGPYLASLNIGEEMLAAGVMSTTEQLGEMGLGMQSQFEIQNVIEAMMEAAAPVKAPSVTTTAGESAANIAAAKAVAKEIGSLENTAVDTVASGISDHMFEGQPINVLSMAENALGSAVENAAITEFAPQPKQTSTTTLKPTPQQPDELEEAIDYAEKEIKSFFDPSVVAPNAQKAAPSVAKKLSRQGMFAQRNNNDENDGINLRYNPSTGELSSGSLGKGLDLSDINLDGGVSKAPTTTATSSAAKIMRFVNALGDTTNLSTAEDFLNSVLHPVDSFKGMTLPGVGLNALNAAIMLGTDGLGEVGEVLLGAAGKTSEIIDTGARSFRSVSEFEKAESEAISAYEKIRVSKDDVSQISKNTGMPEYKIQRIKDHVFSDTHELSTGNIEQFHPDIEISDAWNRLQSSHFGQEDLNLLEHEYFEARFEGIFKTDYLTAHNAAIESGRVWEPERINIRQGFWRK
ncbi:MAG TPA: hypothetical protein VGV92_05655 [Gammaproteobacteria bacterium]|nr:hypothetical protein [Gammaproteobacteria bacterium]